MLNTNKTDILNLVKQRGFTSIFLLIGAFVIIAIGGAYYFIKIATKPAVTPTPAATFQSSQPITLPNPRPIDETANWKTYTDPSSFYSFLYPDVGIQDMSNTGPKYGPNNIAVGTNFGGSQTDEVFQKAFRLVIHFEKNSLNRTLDKIERELQNMKINVKANSLYGAVAIKLYSNGEINGLIYEEDYDNGDQTSGEMKIISLHNNYIYTFTYSNLGNLAAPVGEKTVQKILSTFRFTN